VRQLERLVRFNHFDALRFRCRQLQVGLANARMKFSVF
jgi:hypothetical protein